MKKICRNCKFFEKEFNDPKWKWGDCSNPIFHDISQGNKNNILFKMYNIEGFQGAAFRIGFIVHEDFSCIGFK